MFRCFFPKIIFLFITVLLIPLSSFAENEENKSREVPQPIQELFQSNLVYPQEEDEIQFTLFPSFRKNENSKRVRTLFEVEYGITDAFQIIFEWDGLLYQNPKSGPTISGPGNIEVGAQYSWMALGDGNTHFSFGNLIELPVGPVDNGLTDGFLEVQPFVVLARDFPQFNQSQIFAEFGFSWADKIRDTPAGSDPAFDSINWNVGGFVPIGPWRATMEINGSNNKWDGGDQNEIYITPGVINKLSREWEIGIAAPIGTTKSSDDYRVVGYLMWEFELDDD
ncbi:MAG: hypothetical protein VW455_13530 [Nitrospinota bacterium]